MSRSENCVLIMCMRMRMYAAAPAPPHPCSPDVGYCIYSTIAYVEVCMLGRPGGRRLGGVWKTCFKIAYFFRGEQAGFRTRIVTRSVWIFQPALQPRQ